MNKKRGVGVAITVITICVAAGTLWMAGKARYGNQDVSRESKQEKEGKEDRKTEKESDQYAIDRAASMGETIQIADVEQRFDCVVKSAAVTKTPEGFQLPASRRDWMWDQESIQVDESGQIRNEYSYVIVDLNITNPAQKEQFMYLNTIYLRAGGTEEEAAEAVMRGDRTAEEADEHNYMKLRLQPQESKDLKLVYIEKDEKIEKREAYLVFNLMGGYVDGVRNEYVKAVKFTWGQ